MVLTSTREQFAHKFEGERRAEKVSIFLDKAEFQINLSKNWVVLISEISPKAIIFTLSVSRASNANSGDFRRSEFIPV